MPETRRNIGIAAHVDHGKTTLADQLLKLSGTFAPSRPTHRSAPACWRRTRSSA